MGGLASTKCGKEIYGNMFVFLVEKKLASCELTPWGGRVLW